MSCGIVWMMKMITKKGGPHFNICLGAPDSLVTPLCLSRVEALTAGPRHTSTRLTFVYCDVIMHQLQPAADKITHLKR